uniref:Uncharacterized protein n=1 Tax=Arundo donax TaxID=35708 RepID=A0A0A9AIF8_ARUDO
MTPMSSFKSIDNFNCLRLIIVLWCKEQFLHEISYQQIMVIMIN